MFKQIVVGVDERVGGRDAVPLAKHLLAPDGELALAYVVAGDPHFYRRAREASEHERASQLLETTCQETGAHVSLRWRGSPSVARGAPWVGPTS